MTFTRFVDALGLPVATRVDRRVPKKLLLEYAAPTGADRRLIQDGVEEVSWVAALKPANIAVSAFKDEVREYLEIEVLTVIVRPEGRASRIIDLIHRAVPYPLLLWARLSGGASLSLANKRWSQGHAGQVVMDEVHRTEILDPLNLTPPQHAFLGALALSNLRTGNLHALYQAWLDRVTALGASTVTGSFETPVNAEQATMQRDAMVARTRLQRELASLRARAARERQMARRVELNLTIRRLEDELANTARTLQGTIE